MPVILKVLNDNYPSPERVARFRQEFEIIQRLDLDGVVKAHGLEMSDHSPVIILEDFGGESLNQYVGNKPLVLGDFFPLAICLVEALGQIHQHQVMHKDINPANIVFNAETGQVKIIDFGISAVLSRETTTFRNPHVLEGTLAYMSPEQTGRMNRVMDYRTDFYSLGVTFYELLTGILPFTSQDAMELVHAHIARQPLLPHSVNLELPLVLSQIVMKLLAKNAEDRYQSAYGLKRDLEACWQQWQGNGRIETFSLGLNDISDQFQLPQKLYGRSDEINQLLTAFERVSQGATEMMLVAGYSGIGKSALVQEVYRPITQQRGYFIAGKFDQFQRNIPYASLIQAFRSLVRQLLTESESNLTSWSHKLKEALGPNGQVILDVIPEVELIIGQQPPLPELPPAESFNRFNVVFRNFIHVFTQKEHPLALFLDDLQWADGASLKLLQSLMAAPDNAYLFLIGAYRDNEVGPGHPLLMTLGELDKEGATVTQITLTPLVSADIAQFIADSLNDTAENIASLAELVQAKTDGNPFFMNEFLKSLHQEGWVRFDLANGRWHWDLDQIEAQNITDNVVELMAHKARQLGEKTQAVLKLAACIGNQFDLQTLAIVCECTVQSTAVDLWEAIENGLLIPLNDNYKFIVLAVDGLDMEVEYKFAHDRIQQAVYSLIPETERQAIHGRIGRLLLQNTPEAQRVAHIFDIVNQLNQGRALIQAKAERNKLAQLNLTAGLKANSNAAYEPAYEYLQTGLSLLAADSWQSDYDLTLALYIAAAEAAYLSNDFGEMSRLVKVILDNARDLMDKVKAYEVEIQSYITQNRLLEAVQTALPVLELLGVKFPANPNRRHVLPQLLRTRWALRGKTMDDLATLPDMTDPHTLTVIRVTSRVFSPAFRAAPSLFILFVLKVINLSLQYGNTSLSAFAYACYGLVLCGILGNIEQGYAFGQLALRVLERFNAKELEAKVFVVVYTFVSHWKDHTRTTLPPLQTGYQSGLETGDFEFAAHSLYVYVNAAFIVGEELRPLAEKMTLYAEIIRQLGQTTTAHLVGVYKQVVQNLLEPTETPWRLLGEAYNEEIMLPIHVETNDRNAIFSLYLNKIFLCYLFGQYEEGLRCIEECRKYAQSGAGSAGIGRLHLFSALLGLAAYADASPRDRNQYLKEAASVEK
jgi:predicted ATPase/tRNA A-37 threonylcarbamoyl transferase component Bud32